MIDIKMEPAFKISAFRQKYKLMYWMLLAVIFSQHYYAWEKIT